MWSKGEAKGVVKGGGQRCGQRGRPKVWSKGKPKVWSKGEAKGVVKGGGQRCGQRGRPKVWSKGEAKGVVKGGGQRGQVYFPISLPCYHVVTQQVTYENKIGQRPWPNDPLNTPLQHGLRNLFNPSRFF